jgi:hypothetical protein
MMKCFDFINYYELKLREFIILSEQIDCLIVILKIKN